jgi:hypothetical protein
VFAFAFSFTTLSVTFSSTARANDHGITSALSYHRIHSLLFPRP